MAKGSSTGSGGTGRLAGSHGRRGVAAALVVGWLGMAVWAQLDIEASRQRAREQAEAKLESLTSVAREIFVANESGFVGLLERLRIELRAEPVWPDVDQLSQAGVVQGEDGAPRRLAAILRRALSRTQELTALELVVAGPNGLSSMRLERDASPAGADPVDPREREGIAKALWYADEVARAVRSSGRAVERGDVAFEPIADVDRGTLRLAIGLHAPGEVVQGVLVASVDLAGVADRLAALAAPPSQLALVVPDGRGLDTASLTLGVDARRAALAARASGGAEPPAIFEADGRLAHALPLANDDGSLGELLLLAETPAPPQSLAAWAASPWTPGLVALAIVGSLALTGVLRRPIPVPEAPAAAPMNQPACGEAARDVESPAEASVDAHEIVVRREDFVLREWLADVRGCLEREAATRGLSIDLRCERSLPPELDQDPAWLGGLVVAMGREALDATSGSRVTLEVAEDVDETLRFEIDAGDGRLSPVSGMEQVAGRIGGRIEVEREGRIALVLPNALG